MSKLTDKEIEAINSYGNRIETIENPLEAIRKLPGMYIGHIGTKGYINMCREIFQNAIDQILDPISPGNWFSFFIDERTLEVVVEDNGLSLPYNDMVRIFSSQHTSKNYHKNKGEYSTGLHGSGGKTVNALSELFTVEAYHYDGTAMMISFEKGNLIKKLTKIPNKEKKQGTRISFIPDLSIIGDVTIEWKTLYKLIKTIISLCPIGTNMDFSAIDIHGKRFTEHIGNVDGIITSIIQSVKAPIIKPITMGADDGTRKIEVALCYDSDIEENSLNEPTIKSFANLTPTVQHGTHVDGTIDGITKWFTSYMNNIYLANQKSKDKIKIISSDIKSGLHVVISAAHLEPVLVGQSKEAIGNPDMVPFAKDVVMNGLNEWSKANPQDLAKISKFFKDMAELRIKNEKGKAKIVSKFKQNTITGLPQKYVRPLGKKDIELIIVEGDSALGSVETGRDRYKQGAFPIRGKIANAFKKSYREFFSNEEVQGITRIVLGGDYKRNFTIEDVQVSKVIFMADADPDREYCPKMLFV